MQRRKEIGDKPPASVVGVQDEGRLTIRDGTIHKIESGLDAKLMRAWLDDDNSGPDDTDPYAISHLGWGVNPRALW